MGIFKSEAKFLEGLAGRQHRIWNDSCDYGIELNEMSKGEIDYMKATIELLLELEGNAVTYRMNKPVIQRKYSLKIIWSDYTGDGTKYDILYYKDSQHEFFTIDIKAIRG